MSVHAIKAMCFWTLAAGLAVTQGRPSVSLSAPVPAQPNGPSSLVFSRDGELVQIDPEGKSEKKLTTDERLNPLLNNARLSPDGKRLAILRTFVEGPKTPTRLFLRETGGKQPAEDLGVECTHIAWSADGAELACSNLKEGANGAAIATHFIVNVTTRTTTPLELPDGHFITDWSRDGKHFLTTAMNTAVEPPTAEVHWWARAGKGHKILVGGKREAVLSGQFSPDGTRVLYSRFAVGGGAEDFAPGAMRMAILDLATGKSSPVAGPQDGEIRGYCWSPDGKRIAYTWREVRTGKEAKETASHLVVCSPDGKNAKTIATAKGSSPKADTIVEVSWR
jgi:dipeptidyl aminopeptidase/acylaminoacyl peptidase